MKAKKVQEKEKYYKSGQDEKKYFDQKNFRQFFEIAFISPVVGSKIVVFYILV